MAESGEQVGIRQILLEAKSRWLRPSEVCEILRNYQIFQLTPDPPHKPPGGSLFLFDRKVLRYFRKDGHYWRKKKDGKTVREAHEKLKVGSVDVLHCYYAHGEDNENFQRRSYWMLDGQLEHIVLVHYREVKEANRSGVSFFPSSDAETINNFRIVKTSGESHPAHVDSIALRVQASNASSPSTANWNGRAPSSELEDADSGDDIGSSSFMESAYGCGLQNASVSPNDTAEKSRVGSSGAVRSTFSSGLMDFTGILDGSVNPYILNPLSTFNLSCNRGFREDYRTMPLAGHSAGSFMVEGSGRRFHGGHLQISMSDSFQENYKDAKVEHDDLARNHIDRTCQEHGKQDFFVNSQFQNSCESLMDVATAGQRSKLETEGGQHDEQREMKKLDSFGKWMDDEIGKDCDDSLVASDSGNYWNTLETQNDDKEVSSFSHHMQLSVDSMGPSLSQVQLFSIIDFSPDWAFSGLVTKILVSGKFLGNMESCNSTRWSCMFGEVEVPAEVVANNALRCHTPPHLPGRVPFYITCSNRLACSEIREFEYRENSSLKTSFVAVKRKTHEEQRLQLRLTKLLLKNFDMKGMHCSLENCEKCNLMKDIFPMKSAYEDDWGKLLNAFGFIDKNNEIPKDELMQLLLKDKLYQWLICKVHEGGKGPNVLDDDGLGVIHLAAALGYDWAMSPIVSAGISPSFRDLRGWTGLHWAAYYGREETVVELVRLGAAPGAVEDPTSKFPEGRTAADLAYSRGHKGMAGYLAEADLTSHPSSRLRKRGGGSPYTTEDSVETLAQCIVPQDGSEEHSLAVQNSLTALRNSTQAAAKIQATLHVRSFRLRQLAMCDDNSSDLVNEMIGFASLNKPQRMGHFKDSLHAAAVKIQQKYRGWMCKKEYLKKRNQIIKIQARARGQRLCKQYRKVVWSVSILEKAILRWRRKGVGLRGFRAENDVKNMEYVMGKTDEYEFLRIGQKQKLASVEKALARVQSMVLNKEGRDQYMRLMMNFQRLKVGAHGDASSRTRIPVERNDESILEKITES